MARYLLDTNILLRLADPVAAQRTRLRNVLDRLVVQQNHQCFLTPQVIIEFWSVATRPQRSNGLGWTTDQTRQSIDTLKRSFSLLPDTKAIYPNWRTLVETYQVHGNACMICVCWQ